jgi:pantoate--beta-alanine ligase
MRTAGTLKKITSLARKWVKSGERVGLVPTMGALHEGHLSLVHAARAECDIVVATVFVNPLQFGEGEDFSRYPRDIDADKKLLKKSGVDVLFTTTPDEMYPEPFVTTVSAGDEWSQVLCGASRPGHFAGVLTVVAKLFNLVRPTDAYFGQKDFQQAVLIKRMCEDLNFPIKINICPTLRESDGLAMSSRNLYLGEEERRQAPVIYQALSLGKDLVEKEGMRRAGPVIAAVEQTIFMSSLARIEYIAIVGRETLREARQLEGKLAACAAVSFGETRLIDNVFIEAKT